MSSTKENTAVILAGGKGSRLKPFTMSIPKPMLPIGDIPIIEVVWRQLAKAGFKKVIMLVGHMAYLFRSAYEHGGCDGLDIEFITEQEPLGTAGALRYIKELPDHLLVMNGDLLTDLDFRGLVNSHVEKNCGATIAAHKRTVFIDYGVLVSNDEGFLTEYNEKPTIPYEVSMGIYVLSKEAIQLIPEDGKFDMPQLLSAVQKAKMGVSIHSSECYWQDIGRFEDYQQASADFSENPERFI